MKHIEQMIQRIYSIDSVDNLGCFFDDVTELFHYDWAGLAIFEPRLSTNFTMKFIGEIPHKIRQFIQQDNNIIQYCLSESPPTNYLSLLNSSKPPIGVFKDNQFILIVPINGLANEFASLIFAIPKDIVTAETLEKIGWYWLLFASFIYTRYKKYSTSNQISMTKREQECIGWACSGKTSWEISKLLSISQRTVDFHLANCITKTNSINRQQAIAKYVLNGQLVVSNSKK